MAANIYLGSNLIKYNASPAGNIAAGGINVCAAYVGTIQVFDNCAVANSNVELQLDTSGLSGPSAGYTIGGNLSGFTKSGQPTTPYTAFSTTATVNTSAGYSGSITVSDAPGGTFTTPGGTTINVTTTITGSVSSPTPTYSDTITVVKNNPPLTTGTAGGSNSFGPLAAGTPYDVPVTFAPATGYDYTLTATDGSSTINLSLNSSTGNYEGTLSRTMGSSNGSATITIAGSQNAVDTDHVFNFTTTGLVNATATYTVTGGSGASGNAPATITLTEPYGTSLTPSLTVTTNSGYSPPLNGYTFSATNNTAIQVGTSASPTIVNVSGTATQQTQSISLSGWNGSSKNAGQNCANHACIQPGTSFTAYYTGTLGTATLYTNSLLTNTLPSGWYKYGSGQSVNYSAGSFSPVTCISSVVYTAVATGGAPCGNPLVDYWYINGGFTPSIPLNFVSSTADGCGGTSVTINDGNYWTTTSAAGYGASSGSC